MEIKGLGYRKRCKRYDDNGQAHCLTFSCYHRRPFLLRQRSCQWVLDALKQGRIKELYELWGYVIMPEHVHVVLLPGQYVTIRRILSAIKLPVAQKAIAWIKGNCPDCLKQMEDRQPNCNVSYRFWQRGGGYDRNLRSLSDVREKIHYLHANPVRRGLVATADLWPWSSYQAWMTGKDHPIAIDRKSLVT